MTNVAKDVVAKFSVAFVAAAMLFTLVAPAANAQSESDLQQMINDLLAQVASLQSQLGQGGDSAGACASSWTRDLSTGSTGADVMELQKFLNSDPDTRVAAEGVGSAGMETDYFGGLTAAAVSKFQVKYRSDILSPAGLVNPTGYFGPSSRAKANMLCASAPSMDDDMDDMDDDMDDDMMDDDDDSSDDGDLSGGEADVRSYDFSDEDDEAEEEEEDVPVLNIEFDVEDGDVRLERMDIIFDANDTTNGSGVDSDGEEEPWDAFDEISIWVDGDKVASMDATDEDDWDETTSGSEKWEFRITGIDEIFREDTTGEVIVAVTVQNGVDIANTNNDWGVYIPADGMRFMDGEGLDIEGPTTVGDVSVFEVQEAGTGDDLDLESSDDDPDSSTLEVDEDDEMEHLIFAFDLSADDSDGDVVLDNLVSVNIFVGGTLGTSLDAFIDDFRLEIDGQSFNAESYDGSDTHAVIDFDIDGDVTIGEEETVTALLYANFDDVAASFSDATVRASTTAAQIDAEGKKSGENISVQGSTKTGDTHTVRLQGLTLGSEPTDGTDSSDSVQVISGVSTAANYGTMFLEFDITAFGDDLWVPAASSTRGTAAAGTGITYEILDSGTVTASSGIAVQIDYDIEGADEDNGFFELNDGETYTMVVTIESLDPDGSGLYSFRLNSVGFNDTEDTSPDSYATPDDTTEYISDSVTIQN